MIIRRVFVAVLLLLLVDTVAWAVMCRQLEQGIRRAAAEAPQTGWSLAAGSTRWSGWPLASAIDLSNVSVGGSLLPGLVWQAERARVELSLLHPRTLAIRIGGGQSIAAQGVPAIAVIADRTDVDSDITGAAPPQAHFARVKATLSNGLFTLDRGEITLPADGITAEFTGLSLPGLATPIGRILVRAATDPALPIAEDPEAGARAWREAGGHINIAEAALRWDALEATGSGKITLDNRLQPRAEGTMEASGLPSLLDDLARTGTLAPAQTGAAKAVIAILAAPSGGNKVQLPISLEDGVLRLARFPLLRFPPLVWD